MNGIFQDVRYALRQMRKNPGFSAAAIIVLALGIGATTGMIGIVESVLVHPLPYRNSDRLVILGITKPAYYISQVSYDDFQDIQRSTHLYEQLAAYSNVPVPVQTDDGTQMVSSPAVTTNFFKLLGVHPILGRWFQAGDDAPGAGMAIVGEGFWKNSLHGDKNVIGSKIKVHGDLFTIIGVMPEAFQFPMGEKSLWTTVQLKPKKSETSDIFNPWDSDVRTIQFTVVGRLKPSVTLEQARAEGDAFLKHKLGNNNTQEARFSVLSYLEMVTGNERPALLALLAACVLLLLIAVVNTANLQIARATKRETEIAMRAALGASRARILRQMIVECLIFSIAGAAIGWLLAIGYLKTAEHLFGGYARFNELKLDGWTFAACVFITMLSGVAAALAPAWYLLRRHPLAAQHSASGHASRPNKLSGALVATEVALTCVLLVAAGLFLRTFRSLQNVPLGFVPNHTLGFLIWPPGGISATAQNLIYQSLLDRLEHIHGVKAAGIITSLPVSNFQISMTADFSIPGHVLSNGQYHPQLQMTTVSQHYFKAMGIPILAGRALSDKDIQSSQHFGVVNHAFVEKFLHGVEPIGQQIVFSDNKDGGLPPITIVGVSGDVIQGNGIGMPVQPEVAISYQRIVTPAISFVVHTDGPSDSIASDIRGVVKSEAPEFAIDDLLSLEEGVQNHLEIQRRAMQITSIFAWIALLLSAAGLYGVLAYLVGQRVREIGIRLALGATRENVFALVARQGLLMVAIGLLVGWGGALFAGRWIQSFLFETTTHDFLTYALVGTVIIFASAIAIFIPAHRAAKVDPMIALRYE